VVAAQIAGRVLLAAAGAAADAAAGTAATVRGTAAVAAVRQTALVVQERAPLAAAEGVSRVRPCSWSPGLGPEAQRVRVAAARAAAARAGVAATEPRRAAAQIARLRTGHRRAQAQVAARLNLRRRLLQLHRLLRPRQCERSSVVQLLRRGGWLRP